MDRIGGDGRRGKQKDRTSTIRSPKSYASSLDESALDYRLFFRHHSILYPFSSIRCPSPAPRSLHWSQLCLVPWRDCIVVHLHPSSSALRL